MSDTPPQTGSQRLSLPQVGETPLVPAAPPAPETPAATVEMSSEQIEKLEKDIIAALCTCFDPEIPVNIYELGLIYDIDIKPSGAVGIRMTLTSPGCPVAGSLPGDVEAKVRRVPGVTSAKVDVVWDPPWDKDRMSEAAKLQLGIDDW
ncbi:MAG TPA: SUF system Fe-S cluster assembly protein [Gemmataceae bacterium]|nr:SUF system Fe-S cluster assembly protein [Gemmataceae bacterium]